MRGRRKTANPAKTSKKHKSTPSIQTMNKFSQTNLRQSCACKLPLAQYVPTPFERFIEYKEPYKPDGTLAA